AYHKALEQFFILETVENPVCAAKDFQALGSGRQRMRPLYAWSPGREDATISGLQKRFPGSREWLNCPKMKFLLNLIR
ncbi:hypothetical protein, partial [Schaedlerella arabinosiphila]|uniref:hypothetical protein n=1 Tax=Schaedlerella arabinosiphila TaxID=2044587 RepID=UPI002F419A2E